jgi:hypothetical protein
MFDGVQVFSATLATARAELGEVITAWLQANRALKVVDLVVRQSSDASFHCFTVAVFYLR